MQNESVIKVSAFPPRAMNALLALASIAVKNPPKAKQQHPLEKPRQVVTVAEAGRNDPCPCGSGKKYKKCHKRAER